MTGTVLAFLVRLATGVRLLDDVPEDGKRRIYFANHASHLDFVVIWAALPGRQRAWTRPVAAAEYWEKSPLRRWIASRIFKAVLIPRDLARMRAEDPLGKMLEAIGDGADLIVFPEGTRSDTGAVAPFKPGLHHLATKRPDALLVPVFLENLSRILPKGELLPLPLMGQAVFGEPVPCPAEGESKAAFLERARESVMCLSHGHLIPANDEGS
ncbi:1-acyl-sn-glycerol-3-phosphate acyltransferase [Luteolibacter flavescens]|uniref:1-acyl-sn-glycerol-3-phosphate acyltransferase n=1 Tax=Luteolibacter flavescens TaxID=1859460 RepID=A0ABT3FS04_9BACT|nr:lysophospholipid acyltransferase family protein [Luteolibacter flavescens]MCW1885760.1 1-acyl-sn-glycerol-3-phosphate acyltransferase [Luteolibacter flavescens]